MTGPSATTEAHIAALVKSLGVQQTLTRGVLLVDDELANVKVLRSFLDDSYVVHEATCGKDALALAEAHPLDLVITDQRMEGMSGVELLERLKVLKPDVAGIVLTGYADTTAMMSAINRAAVFRFLKKPWEPEDILEAIARASEHVSQQRTIQQLVGLLAHRTDELGRSLDELKTSQCQLLHLERLGTMGQLAAGITHDVRNVMVSLRAVEWEIQQSKATPPELLETVQVGMGGLDNLVRTLDALHSFARGGAAGLRLRPCAPGTVVNDAIAIARMDGAFKSRQVDVRVEASLPLLSADQQKLTQVMVNLVRNALQATRERDHISVEASAPESGSVVLSVEDTGPGIAPELRERLFQPFASSKGEGGLGMGLYMARLIVESHRGNIHCSEGSKGGARFMITLPAQAA